MTPSCQNCYRRALGCGPRVCEWHVSDKEHVGHCLAASPVTPWINTSLLAPREVTASTAATLVGLSCGTSGVRLGE